MQASFNINLTRAVLHDRECRSDFRPSPFGNKITEVKGHYWRLDRDDESGSPNSALEWMSR